MHLVGGDSERGAPRLDPIGQFVEAVGQHQQTAPAFRIFRLICQQAQLRCLRSVFLYARLRQSTHIPDLRTLPLTRQTGRRRGGSKLRRRAAVFFQVVPFAHTRRSSSPWKTLPSRDASIGPTSTSLSSRPPISWQAALNASSRVLKMCIRVEPWSR